jgi:hypothetical protein
LKESNDEEISDLALPALPLAASLGQIRRRQQLPEQLLLPLFILLIILLLFAVL